MFNVIPVSENKTITNGCTSCSELYPEQDTPVVPETPSEPSGLTLMPCTVVFQNTSSQTVTIKYTNPTTGLLATTYVTAGQTGTFTAHKHGQAYFSGWYANSTAKIAMLERKLDTGIWAQSNPWIATAYSNSIRYQMVMANITVDLNEYRPDDSTFVMEYRTADYDTHFLMHTKSLSVNTFLTSVVARCYHPAATTADVNGSMYEDIQLMTSGTIYTTPGVFQVLLRADALIKSITFNFNTSKTFRMLQYPVGVTNQPNTVPATPTIKSASVTGVSGTFDLIGRAAAIKIEVD